jgi:hypothetical protein
VATGVSRSESFGELAAARARAQAKLRHPSASRTNTRFGNRYASLADVYDATLTALAEEGISVWATTRDEDDGRVTVVHLFAREDQWLESDYSVRPTADDPQAKASATTYARRNGLCTAVGVAHVDDDDDANAATPLQLPVGRITARYAALLRETAAADGASPHDIAAWVRSATDGRTDILEEVTQADLGRLRAAKEAWLTKTAPTRA